MQKYVYKNNVSNHLKTRIVNIKMSTCTKKLANMAVYRKEQRSQKHDPVVIERGYPRKKYKKNYPLRWNNSVFEKLNQMIGDRELQNNYKKWKQGINYNTNRKIKKGGKLHRKLESNFRINGTLFENLLNIDQPFYLQKTDEIKRAIDLENDAIEKYNKEVDDIIEIIKRLKSWDDFVIFDGMKYGLVDKMKGDIHIENN